VDIVIRPMREEDHDEVVTLLARWNLAPAAPTPAVPEPERTQVIVDNTFVALDGDRIVGVCSHIRLSETLAEGASLAVDPAYHGSGVGEKLMRAGRREMYARGIRKIRSESDRPRTIAWLVKRFGYRVVGTAPKRHAFGESGIGHWTVLECDLTAPPGPERDR
jgi:N-acetylglutamate synthase-like GNAT family acetyltransferase